MKIFGIILFVLGFIGCQVFLFMMLRKLDRYFDSISNNAPSLTQDDSCGQTEDVVE